MDGRVVSSLLLLCSATSCSAAPEEGVPGARWLRVAILEEGQVAERPVDWPAAATPNAPDAIEVAYPADAWESISPRLDATLTALGWEGGGGHAGPIRGYPEFDGSLFLNDAHEIACYTSGDAERTATATLWAAGIPFALELSNGVYFWVPQRLVADATALLRADPRTAAGVYSSSTDLRRRN